MSEGLAKVGVTILILIGMCIPVLVFLAANSYLEPVTFFEKATMFVLAYVFLGGIQIWLLIIGIMGLIKVWAD